MPKHNKNLAPPAFAIKANRFFNLNVYFFVFMVLAFFYLQQYLEDPPYAILLSATVILGLALYSNRTYVLSFYADHVLVNPSFVLSNHHIRYADVIKIEKIRSVVLIHYRAKKETKPKIARFSTAHMHKNMSDVAMSYLTEKVAQFNHSSNQSK